jgi:hypothetical protein
MNKKPVLSLNEQENYDNGMPEEEKYYNNTNNQDMNQDEDDPVKKFFEDFNNEDIDFKDPSLDDQLVKIYEEEVPFEIRTEDENLSENEKSIFQNLVCKIFSTDESIEQINVKIEIANDKDLFFYYSCEIDSALFDEIKENQKLTCNFNDFPELLIKYFDFCIKEQKSYLAVMNIKSDKKAVMELLENLEYKFVELININFVPASDDLIREQISYRYNSMRATHEITQSRIEIINGVLKDHDPQLITEVKKEIDKANNVNSAKNRSIKNKNIKNKKSIKNKK